MYVIKNVDVYAPGYLGKKDVLVSSKIEKIADHIDTDLFDIIDGTNKILIPGLIDGHVHITGGGGEGSFHTKAPEVSLSDLTTSGITTVVGMLGTDGISRSVENLLSKAKALKEEGMNCYILSGSYQYPAVTITGDLKKDIMFIEEVIGCKLALSDHRSSYVTSGELSRVASDVRVSSLLSNKAGILVLHMGDDKEGLKKVFKVLKKTSLPITLFRPTHVTRCSHLLEDAFKFLTKGGYIDMTADEKYSPSYAIMEAKERGLPLSRITVSSDGGGSYSNYDKDGNLINIGVSSVHTLFDEFRFLSYKTSIEEALPFFSKNVAEGLHLNKGRIEEGYDSDLVLLDQNMKIDMVMIRGKIMIQNKKIVVKGTYE